jgi:hypothetical protein
VPDANRVGGANSNWHAVLTTLMSGAPRLARAKIAGPRRRRVLLELARHLERTSDLRVRERLACIGSSSGG